MKSLLILIAGPVRSGTHNRAELIDANLNNMAQVALRVYQKGHIPVVGEWLALPIAKAAGSTEIGDAISEEYLYPVAHRVISRCDAILRMPGESRGADLDIEEGKKGGCRFTTAWRRSRTGNPRGTRCAVQAAQRLMITAATARPRRARRWSPRAPPGESASRIHRRIPMVLADSAPSGRDGQRCSFRRQAQ